MKIPFTNLKINFRNLGWKKYNHLMLIPTIVIGIKQRKQVRSIVFKIILFKPVYTFALKIEAE